MWIYKIQRKTIFSDCKSHWTQICICLGIRIFFFRICKTCMHPITCRSPVPCWNMKRNHQLSRSHRMFTNLHILLTYKGTPLTATLITILVPFSTWLKCFHSWTHCYHFRISKRQRKPRAWLRTRDGSHCSELF